MSTKSNKAPAAGALLLGAAMTCLVAGSTTPAQAGIANASLAATATTETTTTTEADLVGVPINASYWVGHRHHRHHHHHYYHYRRHHHHSYYSYHFRYYSHYRYSYYYRHHHRHFWGRPGRIIIVVPVPL
jgi:hypothetical protein